MDRRNLGSRRGSSWRHPLLAAATATAAAVALTTPASAAPSNATWPTGGQNIDNSRYQPSESSIDAASVSTLAPKTGFGSGGAFHTGGGDVIATPAVDGERVYFPTSDGKLFAIDRSTGATKWSTSIGDLTGIKPANDATGNDFARATPAIAGRALIIGTQSGKFQTPDFAADHPDLAGAYVLALDRVTGALLWKTKVDSHFAAMVTQAAQVYGQTAFVGLTSNEEEFANQDLSGGIPYTCCTFRGKLVALDVKTGQTKWVTYTVPGDPGYSGADVWGSRPAIDPQRNAVYITTGNNYSLPADRTACVEQATTDTEKQACVPGDHFDAIMSLDMRTGAINWSYRTLPSDVWNADCGVPGFSGGDTNPGNCPSDPGPGYDFGQGPMLLTAKIGGKKTPIVGAGQKSGDFHVLDRDTGALLWKTHVGPGGLAGGLMWGSATDGKRIYVAESNSSFLNQPGWWSALDPDTGAVLWKTTDPGTGIGGESCPFFPGCTWASVGIGYGYSTQGPVSAANGVVYGCSLNPVGPNVVAMDGATGEIKWSYASGSSCVGGAAIVNGTVYWGMGDRSAEPLTTRDERLLAFTRDGR